MSIPQTTIRVCSGVRLNSRYEHSIYFADRTAQYNYFAGKVVKTFSAYSFIRKTWDLNVAATMEEATSWNYLFFQNYTNGKTYYYFVDNIEYVNDGTVRLKLQIDVLQTYLFDFSLLPSFIDRQHTETDEPGEHTVEEGLETGELVTTLTEGLPLLDLCVLIASTYDPAHTDKDNTREVVAAKVSNCYSGLCISACAMSDYVRLGAKLGLLAQAGKLDGIVTMWMYPKNLVVLADGESWSDENPTHLVSHCEPFFFEPGRPSTLAGYVPRNNKLFTYPYCMYYVTNNLGNAAAFKYERFGSGEPRFKVVGTATPGGAVRLYPLNYNGDSSGYEEGLTLDGFPTCAWNSDVYAMWLAQNQSQQNLSMLTSGVKIAGGIAAAALTGGVGAAAGFGAIYSGFSEIAGQVAQMKDRAIEPPQAKGSFSATVNVANNWHTFVGKRKCVNPEQAKIIDDFFTMYGYKVSRVMTPNINARKSFTYVKTIGCHIAANLCNEDTVKIESIFNNGVTFWKNGDRIGSYTDDNSTM